MISNKKLTKLSAMQRMKSHLQKISSRIKASQTSKSDIQRASNIVLRKTRPTVQTTVKLIKKILDKMAFANTSMNTFKSNRKSFAKPNRRDPDDFNKKGIVTSTKFIPDIHVYLDTSGSISEDMYKDSIQSLITIAKKLNVNLYFNSFSHILSQTTCLHTKDKSINEIYKTFQKIPKVSGGTNFEQIWSFINISKKRTREFSLIITDFEYHAPNKKIKHPKNLYYTACGVVAWKSIIRYAERFAETAKHIDPNISARFLL